MLELILSIVAGIFLIFFVLLINSFFAAMGRSITQDVRKARQFPDSADAGGFAMQGMKKNLKNGKASPQQRPA